MDFILKKFGNKLDCNLRLQFHLFLKFFLKKNVTIPLNIFLLNVNFDKFIIVLHFFFF